MTNASQPDAATNLPDNAAVPVTDRLMVRVSGAGTDKFLHGQFSQSLEEVTRERALRAAACTPKGRAYCLTRLARDGDDIVMDLPADLADEILSQLRKYLMLFRGTSMEILEQARIVGLLGQAAARQLSPEVTRLKEDGDTLPLDNGLLIRTRDTAEGLQRYEYWLPAGSGTDTDHLTQASLADWHASEIAAGVPWLTPASFQQYVPQMLNWQHLNGVHFKKGCYTGQEVIARMHFLGQLKKSLFRLGTDGAPSSPVTAGTPVMSGDRECGAVVNTITFEDGRVECLAVIRHASSEDALSLAGGTPVQIRPLPYAVPERDSSEPAET